MDQPAGQGPPAREQEYPVGAFQDLWQVESRCLSDPSTSQLSFERWDERWLVFKSRSGAVSRQLETVLASCYFICGIQGPFLALPVRGNILHHPFLEDARLFGGKAMTNLRIQSHCEKERDVVG
jgi:hypothetical protein